MNAAPDFTPAIEPYLGDVDELKNRQKIIVDLFDTTLRDGEQAEGSAMTMDEKVWFADKSARAGVAVHEVGFPASNDDMLNVREVSRALRDHDVEVCGLASCREEHIDLTAEALQDATHKRIHTFLATSDVHLAKKLGMSFTQALNQIEKVVSYAKETYPDAAIEFSPEDATRTSIENLIIACRTAIAAGAEIINVPDTNGIANPDYVRWMFQQLNRNTEDLRKDGHIVTWSFHGHNDQSLGVANALAAISGGARQVEACWGDNGERAGNFPIEEVALALDMQGAKLHPDYVFQHELDRRRIIPTARSIYEIMGRPIPESRPLIGNRIVLHGAGIHTDGSYKDGQILGEESTYNLVDINKYGGQVPEKPVGSRAGGADIVQALENFEIISSKKEVGDILERVTAEAVKGRRVFPAHVLYEMSKLREGLSDITFERENGTLRAMFEYDGKIHVIEESIKGDNSGIQALMNGLRELSGQDIDVIQQSEIKQNSLAETEANYEAAVKNGGAKKSSEAPPSNGSFRGSESIGISKVVIGNKDKSYNVHVAGQNVTNTNLEAIFIGAWPFLRQKLLYPSLFVDGEEKK